MALTVCAVTGYALIAAALNRPLGAHSVGVNAVGAPGATTTTSVPKRSPVRPRPLRATRPGNYDLRVDVNGHKTSGVLAVGRDGTQQVSVDGLTQESKLVWSAKAVLVRTGRRGAESCEWTPAPVVFVPRLEEGRRWSSSASCTTTVDNNVVTITRAESSKVTRAARATLDGQPIDTWVIERHIVTTQHRGPVTSVVEQASTELFAPGIGLPVFKLVRTETPRPDGTVDTLLQSIELVSGVPH